MVVSRKTLVLVIIFNTIDIFSLSHNKLSGFKKLSKENYKRDNFFHEFKDNNRLFVGQIKKQRVFGGPNRKMTATAVCGRAES